MANVVLLPNRNIFPDLREKLTTLNPTLYCGIFFIVAFALAAAGIIVQGAFFKNPGTGWALLISMYNIYVLLMIIGKPK